MLDFYSLPIFYKLVMAVIMGSILRIFLMDGFMTIPEIKDGKIKLNSFGTIIASVTGFIFVYQAAPQMVGTMFAAFSLAYLTPHLLEKARFKRIPQDPQPTPEEDIA